MNVLKALFQNYKFRTKLLLSYLLIAFIPAALVGAVSFHTTSAQMEQQTISTQNFALTNAANNIRTRMNEMRRVSELIQYYYTQYMRFETSQNAYEDLKRTQQLKANLTLLRSRFDLKSLQFYFSNDFGFSNEGIYFFQLNELPELLKELGMKKSPELYSDKDYWCYREKDQSRLVLEKEDALRLVRTIRGADEEQIIAGYFIDIEISDIGYFVNEITRSETEDVDSDGGLLDENGNMLYLASTGSGGKQIPISWPTEILEADSGILEKDGYLYNIVKVPETSWTLFSKISLEYIHRESFLVGSVALLAIFLSVLLAMLISFYISSILSKKLGRLVNAMQKLNPDFANTRDITNLMVEVPIESRMKKRSSDELDQLADTYNSMIQHIQALMESVVLHETAAEKQKIALLQAQIKPHFLYNVLASIQAFIVAGNVKDANNIIRQLSLFYRAHLKAPDEMITLQRELDSVFAYLHIESLCYPGKIMWSNYISPEWREFKILHFTLQPIVENCICHAVKADVPLHIQLFAEAERDDLILCVKDNGCGISSERLSEIQRQLTENRQVSEGHFGIFNVHARLRLYHGCHYGISIESSSDEGTVVTIRLPLLL